MDLSKCSETSGCSRLALASALLRAESIVTRVDSLAVPWMTPPPAPPDDAWKNSGNCNMPASQSIMTTSSSVHAGLAIQLKPMQAIASDNMSAQMAGYELAVGK